jgi:hypothetical protein
LRKYLETLDSIDAAYFAAINRAKGLEKVIILPLDSARTVHLGFTVREFEDLKTIIRNYLSGEGEKERESRFIGPDQFHAVILN